MDESASNGLTIALIMSLSPQIRKLIRGFCSKLGVSTVCRGVLQGIAFGLGGRPSTSSRSVYHLAVFVKLIH